MHSPHPPSQQTASTRFFFFTHATQRTRRAVAAAAVLVAALALGLAGPALAAPPKKAAASSKNSKNTKSSNNASSGTKSSSDKSYNKAGASFQYPGSWKIVLDEVDEKARGIHNIDLQGPNDELITLSFIPFMAGKDIEAFAARAASHRAELAARESGAGATQAQPPVPPTPPAEQALQPQAQPPQSPPVPAEQEVGQAAPQPQPQQPAADGSNNSNNNAAATAPAPAPAPAAAAAGSNKVSSITPVTSSTISRSLPGGKTVKGVLHRFSYVAQDSSVPVEAGFFAMDFGPSSSVTIMTQTMVEHAKSMEAAQGLVMGSLRYRPVKR